MKCISVQATARNGRVVLWEKNAAHPHGEIYVVGDGQSFEVAETAAVKRLLGEGVLVAVSAGHSPLPTTVPVGEEGETGDLGEAEPVVRRRRKMNV